MEEGKRIATGSGTKVQSVNQVVKQFDQMKVLMKSMANGQMPTPQQMAKLAGGNQRAPRPRARRVRAGPSSRRWPQCSTMRFQ